MPVYIHIYIKLEILDEKTNKQNLTSKKKQKKNTNEFQDPRWNRIQATKNESVINFYIYSNYDYDYYYYDLQFHSTLSYNCLHTHVSYTFYYFLSETKHTKRLDFKQQKNKKIKTK